ncbi:MAG: hypothetical protein ACI9LM_002700 [Alteromonadaceae bacterium]|jgi:hypothetical protein
MQVGGLWEDIYYITYECFKFFGKCLKNKEQDPCFFGGITLLLLAQIIADYSPNHELTLLVMP